MNILETPLTISSAYKTLPQTGNMVYEYNPFRNYRLNTLKFEYNNLLYSLKELEDIYNITLAINGKLWPSDTEITIQDLSNVTWSLDGEPLEKYNCPIARKPGELVDFDTDELKFSLNNPVNILPLYSYDGSVNLILNDDLNVPRLINSRFSPLGKNKYQIVDRLGDSDTNIYDQGVEFNIDTSLYKKTIKIPQVFFLGVFYGGNMSIGNYHFYFKYTDADGNETDFIAETGLVSMFIGNSPVNIRSGFRKENSYKGVVLQLSNLDLGYPYISVYYTVATSDINENSTTAAYKINLKFLINTVGKSSIKITGYESVSEISVDEINLKYLIVSSAKTLELCLNMLFLGNVKKSPIDYTNLTDISLRFTPYLSKESYIMNTKIDQNYEEEEDYENSYYDPQFIYNKVGYYPGEIYRLGIVYILNDTTLSPVFNIRGMKDIPIYKEESTSDYTEFTLFHQEDDTKNQRNYITYNEDDFLIKSNNSDKLENVKGVISLKEDSGNINIYGITIKLLDLENCILELKNLGVKGYFFVRLKRIPTTLCEALTIGIDKLSHTPLVHYNDVYYAESFLNLDNRYLSHLYVDHLYKIKGNSIDIGAICPEYDINSPYLNSLFTGGKFTVVLNNVLPAAFTRDLKLPRHYYTNTIADSTVNENNTQIVKIIGVEDNTKLVAIDDTFFSARAGEESETYRFDYILYKNKSTESTNLIRGSFGPYLGLTNCTFKNSLISIKIPNYNKDNIQDYFMIRYEDLSSYYAISSRLSIDTFLEETFYRGDCYICLVTHRINRNFQDPSAPTNDLIVDEKCWKNNFKVEDGVVKTENFSKINLGDVNAVQLGQWVTFTVRSSFNLCIRAIDESNVDEKALTGINRSFYPNIPISTSGSYKIPEALCYNKGFLKNLSERVNFELPNVPAIKNDFSNRILYSNISVNDAFENGFRVFKETNYRDYPKTYGEITKLVEINGSLLCICEHGIMLIPVNERALVGDSIGGLIYINTSNVLPENPKIISDVYGSLWRDSIIKTPSGVYGVDTVAKKIWRTDGSTIECISDFKIQGFLNRNITLTERETTPILGIRNVKTHYNAFKHDVMFTFYDNLCGYDEKVWNLCWNELMNNGRGAFVTFYSWVPSFSENIYNSFFSFDRNTSKYIAKLGVSKSDNSFSTGITLKNNIIRGNHWKSLVQYKSSYENKENIICSYTYKLNPDIYGNYKLFNLNESTGELTFVGEYSDIKAEFYERNNDGTIKIDTETGRRKTLKTPINSDKLVLYLNIQVNITIQNNDDIQLPSTESYINSILNNLSVDTDQYKSVIALIPDYNKLFLTTDFWKHGQSNTIDISDTILPTHWYGKQHPFEFEFVVADNPQLHKIFDNLIIISNNAEPESFHYEIIGDCYDFAKDKKNMYIRLEATKHLYKYNGSAITYDSDYINLQSEHRKNNSYSYDKSTLFPLYYLRRSNVNTIEDSYIGMTSDSKDYSALSGAEITHDTITNEYYILNHAKAVNITDPVYGRLRGNMLYKEDKWNVLINPLNFVLKNEKTWQDLDKKETSLIPVELKLNPLPDDVLSPQKLTIPDNFKNRGYVFWHWLESDNKEVKIKDKWIKIRIRYTGEKLAIITAIRTLYSISYS